MRLDRREVLAALGVASASTWLAALGCGGHPPELRRAPRVGGEVRTWLHDAVARLATRFPQVHALAVSRRRTTAALDVAGAGLARTRRDGAVLSVRDPAGLRREHVISELTADGIAAAVRALGATRPGRALDFGPPPAATASDEPPPLDARDLRQRVERLQRDATPSSRIVYAAAAIDVDEAIVWSVAPGRDRAQRLVRIRQTAIRAAWNGDRPAIAHAERAGTGTLDELALTADELAAASAAALELMTPGELAAGDATVVLDPSAAALVLDAVARHLPAGAVSPLVTLIDDPTAAGAYGGFAFDDEGELAAPLTLIDRGRVTARLDERAGRARRPGHLGLVEAAPSHLVLAPGGVAPRALYGDGFLLERGVDLAFDPATDRVRLACARARELKAGNPTGRVYADVELVGSLRAVLAAIDGVADAPGRFALPSLAVTSDATAQAQRGDPLWRSIAAPAIRTRGVVRPRRSRA